MLVILFLSSMPMVRICEKERLYELLRLEESDLMMESFIEQTELLHMQHPDMVVDGLRK
jgi:hypothetical protein